MGVAAQDLAASAFLLARAEMRGFGVLAPI
jgi:hypothetical protein